MGSKAQQYRERFKAQIQKVDVPGLGEMYVRKLSVNAVKRLDRRGSEKVNGSEPASNWDTLVDIVIEGTCDENRAALFGDEDREWLRTEVDLGTLTFITDAIQKLNPNIWAAQGDLEKNSEKTASSGSDSSSPPTSA